MQKGATDNLDTFADQAVVFDDTRSDIRTLTGHRVSFVFPSWIGQKPDEFQTVIINAETVFLNFELGQEIDSVTFNGSFKIHDEKFPASKVMTSMHAGGMDSLKRLQAGNFRYVVGADSPCKPRALFLSSVHVQLDTKVDAMAEDSQLQIFRDLLAKVNNMTGRTLQLIPNTERALILEIPATWILQDLTAIAKATNRDPAKATPVIKKPLAFPSLASRIIVSSSEGQPRPYIIEDFEIVRGKVVQVLLVDPTDRTNSSFLDFSKVYASSEKELFNPAIIRILTPKAADPTLELHRLEALDIIQRGLSAWGLWKICEGKKGYKVMVESLADQANAWMTPSDALKSKDHRIISFESGAVVYDDDLEGEEIIDDIEQFIKRIPPNDDGIATRMIFNTVIGNAQSMINGKPVELYFAAKNGQELAFNRIPLFSAVPYPSKPVVDVLKDKWFLGVPGKSVEKKHSDKTVLRWVAITEPFRNFYLWVTSSGKNPLFKGKSSSEIRELFRCFRFPQLVEMFNFMIFGATINNPTRKEAWTTWFIQDALGLDPSLIN